MTHTLAIFVDHGIHGSYTMMASSMKTLELHYPMIQLLINRGYYMSACGDISRASAANE